MAVVGCGMLPCCWAVVPMKVTQADPAVVPSIVYGFHLKFPSKSCSEELDGVHGSEGHCAEYPYCE